MTKDQATQIGMEIAILLGLKSHNELYPTGTGPKDCAGLARTIINIIDRHLELPAPRPVGRPKKTIDIDQEL